MKPGLDLDFDLGLDQDAEPERQWRAAWASCPAVCQIASALRIAKLRLAQLSHEQVDWAQPSAGESAGLGPDVARGACLLAFECLGSWMQTQA